MTYGLELRERAVKYVQEGGQLLEASKIFGVHRQSLWRWLQMEDLHPKPSKTRCRKLDKVALLAHVKAEPDSLLRERARHFGVRVNSIWVALKKMDISKKKQHVTRRYPTKVE
jgi:putative transposase